MLTIKMAYLGNYTSNTVEQLVTKQCSCWELEIWDKIINNKHLFDDITLGAAKALVAESLSRKKKKSLKGEITFWELFFSPWIIC